jgi:hypothetical protein
MEPAFYDKLTSLQFHLHQSMYLTSLKTQSNDIQKKKFLKPAEYCPIDI